MEGFVQYKDNTINVISAVLSNWDEKTDNVMYSLDDLSPGRNLGLTKSWEASFIAVYLRSVNRIKPIDLFRVHNAISFIRNDAYKNDISDPFIHCLDAEEFKLRLIDCRQALLNI